MAFFKKWRRLLLFLATLVVLTYLAIPPIYSAYNFPTMVRLVEGEGRVLELDIPFFALVLPDREGIVALSGEETPDGKLYLGSPIDLKPLSLGRVHLDFQLFGFIPFRQVVVDVLPRLELYPGGQCVGVTLRAEGVLVVGHSAVRTVDGRTVYPGREAGILIGDSIVAVDGSAIQDIDEIGRLVDKAGREKRILTLSIKRGGRLLVRQVKPEYCAQTRGFRIGLFIRDRAAGVGTLTFSEPRTGVFGALGHVICDADTKRPIPVEGGQLVKATIQSIIPGVQGEPGEVRGTFHEGRDVIGEIERNTEFGIFGTVTGELTPGFVTEPVPIGLAEDIKAGPAYILTGVGGDSIEKYDIEITRVARGSRPSSKGLKLKITDERLLEKTGGIIQGMSGSPIIQNGKLVGAVTHVIVGDPTEGHGVLMEWMVLESGLLEKLTWED